MGLGTAVAWIERILRTLDRFQQGHTVLGFPVAVAKKYGDDQAGKHAALLAYYGFLSLFPLLLVFVTLLGYALANNQELQQQIIDTPIAQFPILGSQIKDSITTCAATFAPPGRPGDRRLGRADRQRTGGCYVSAARAAGFANGQRRRAADLEWS